MNTLLIALAMLQTSPAEEAEFKATAAKVIACINAETDKLGPLTTEPASDMAAVAAERCSGTDTNTRAMYRVLPVARMANERILRIRTGDKTPLADPFANMTASK